MELNVLVAEDDQAVRKELSNTLAYLAPAAIHIHEAGSVESTIKQGNALKPDLLFMNILLENQETYAIIGRLHHHPEIVLISGHDDQLPKALDFGAYRLLKKPLQSRLIHKTLTDFIASHRAYAYPPHQLFSKCRGKIGLHLSGRLLFVHFSEIFHCEAIAGGKSTRLMLQDQQATDLRPLKAMESLLAPYGIVRIHKSYLINIQHIAEIIRTKKYWTVSLKNHTEFHIPAKRIPAFKHQLKQYHIMY